MIVTDRHVAPVRPPSVQKLTSRSWGSRTASTTSPVSAPNSALSAMPPRSIAATTVRPDADETR